MTDSVTVTGAVDKPLTLKKLKDFSRVAVTAPLVEPAEDGMDSSIVKVRPLRPFWTKPGCKKNLNTVMICSGPDGYRSLLSYGELFLSSYGSRIIVADRLNGKPIEDPGTFWLVVS